MDSSVAEAFELIGGDLSLDDESAHPDDSPERIEDLPPALVGRRLAQCDWDFRDARSDELTHALHPYPAKFVPQLARQAIGTLSRPGELVLDPFSGGGTTAVEALALGRGCVSIDANPLANAIGRTKTTSLNRRDGIALQHLEAALLMLDPDALRSETPSWLPQIPNRPKWYADEIARALGVVRDRVLAVDAPAARQLALVAFAQTATRLSFQESETRYKSVPREIEVLEVPRTLVGELRRVRRVAAQAPDQGAELRFVDGDARAAESYRLTAPGSVGLVVTSPPYPNAYDYHLYHRFRLFWLGYDPGELRRVEIGSHLTNQARQDPAMRYLVDIGAVLEHCLRALAKGRYALVVVGDGLFDGEGFATAHHLAELAEHLGFDHVATVDRRLPVHRRSVTKAGRRLETEQLVLLRRPASARSAAIVPPNYRLFPYERELHLRELRALGGSPRTHTNSDVIDVVPVRALENAAFAHGVEDSSDGAFRTVQARLERGLEEGSRRKESAYLTHGIHRYKGKFYPQLAKCLLNLSGLEHGSLVVDPFGGSGTVALEAALGGFDALSIDRNPLATAIASAKLLAARTPSRRSLSILKAVRERVAAAPRNGSSELSQFPAPTLAELERWFPPPVLAKLDYVLHTVRMPTNRELRPLLEVLVSDIVREVSQQEPKDLRIRRRSVPIDDAPVYELLTERIELTARRLTAWARERHPADRPLGEANALLGDATDPATFGQLEGRQIAAVVSSPPYASALPYVDTDRLSLAAVLGISTPERKAIEDAMVGSREITERTRIAEEERLLAQDDLPESTRSFLCSYRAAVAADLDAGFRLKRAPAVLYRYFRAMSDTLSHIGAHMVPGSPCWLVLGDSSSTVAGQRWTIPTTDEVAAIAAWRGFRVVERIPITVTRENLLNARHAITRNEILALELAHAHP